ncbi:ATP-binding protein [Fredinandcohnia humi]
MGKQNKVIIPNGGEAVMAEYKEQKVMEYRDNPLIEALPLIFSKEEAIDKLASYPPFEINERNLDAHIRLHLVQRIFEYYYQPLSQVLDLESRISRMIRRGYVHRNPLKPEYAKELQNGYKNILNGNIEIYNDNFKTTSSTMTIIGPSGLGKSTNISRILKTIPQIIIHSRYKKTDFNMYQLSWIKMDCSFDGTVKGLCIDFFRIIDSLIGSSYHRKFGSGRQPIASLQPAILQISRVHSIGLIIIDEVQSLSVAKSGGAEKMMNFFHYLSNMGIPLLLIGTPKALPSLRGDFRQARRGSGQGDMVLERLKQDSNWDLILEGMWDYQWVRKPTAITQEFKDILYDESGGITDIAIKLFVMAQVKAISSGKEEITPSLIRKVARENLQLIQPMINAIRSGDIKAISRYEDITLIDVEGFINQEFATVSMNDKIKEIQKAKKKQEKDWKENVREQAIVKLIELDVEPAKAKKCVDSVMEQQGKELDIKGIIKEAFKLSFNIEEGSSKLTKRSKKMELQNKQDLRLIVSEGKANGLFAHEALKEKGIIKVVEDDFFGVG